MVLVLLWGYINTCFAGTLLTGNGIITYPQEKEKRSEVLFAKHSFTVSETSVVTLHFISHIDNNVIIKVINSETENEIKAFCQRISRDSSPFDETINLAAGKYTLMVYKVKSTNSSYNTGEYAFVITADAVAQQQVKLSQARTSTPVSEQQPAVQTVPAAANNSDTVAISEKKGVKQESKGNGSERQNWNGHIADWIGIFRTLYADNIILKKLHGIFLLLKKLDIDFLEYFL